MTTEQLTNDLQLLQLIRGLQVTMEIVIKRQNELIRDVERLQVMRKAQTTSERKLERLEAIHQDEIEQYEQDNGMLGMGS